MVERGVLSLALVVALSGCTNFPAIEANVCGNAIVEEDEDCDTFHTLEDGAKLEGGKCLEPGSENACHWDCRENNDGSRANCPDGWGCDRQGVCREPTGGFVAGAPFDTSQVSWLGVADFDGDTRADLISVAPTDNLQFGKFALHYFEGPGATPERHDFPLSVSRPLARDLNGDGADDLVFSNGAVGLLPGRRDRAWVPSTFVSYQIPGSRLRSASVRDERVDKGTALVAATAFQGEAGLWVPEELSQTFVSIAGLDGAVEDLLGGVVNGDLVEGVDSPCRELVLAFRDRSFVRIVDVCERAENAYGASWRDRAVDHVVSLPEGRTLDGPPLIADLDGNGHLDVLLAASGGLFAAFGDGVFLSPAAVPYELTFVSLDDRAETETLRPIAAGDFSGDGIADFVLPDKVLSSRPRLDGSTFYELSQANYGADWTVATFADLNGNGLVDAVAASDTDSDIIFFNGTGSPYQISTVIRTEGPVAHLVADDFDGDLVGDIAFTQRRDPTSSVTELMIAFGGLSGPPKDVVQVAQTDEEPEELVTFHEIGIGSMLVNWSTGQGETFQGEATLLQGSADRLPFAPRALVSFGIDGNLSQASGTGLCLGNLTGAGATDAMALGLERLSQSVTESAPLLQFWLLPDMGRSNLPPRRMRGALPPNSAPIVSESGDFGIRLAAVAGDFDGDGRDEATWVMPEGDEGCLLVTYAISRANATEPRLQQRALLHFEESCPTPQIEVQDLDADGALDLVLLIGDEKVAPRRLQLLWNDGAGNFSLESRTVLGARAGDVRGFSAFAEPKARIAFAAENALYVASSSSIDKRAYETLTELEPLVDGRSVVVTDRNGDGLADMVVADRSGLFLLEAQLK